MDDPRFARITTKSAFKNLFFIHLLMLKTSSGILFTSSTVGFFKVASTIPANHPHASIGFIDVKGAITKAVNILSGCGKQSAVKAPAKTELNKNHDFI